MGHTFEFRQTVFPHAEDLTLVLEDIVAGPLLLPRSGFRVLGPDNLALAFKKVEVHWPVANPVDPTIDQRFGVTIPFLFLLTLMVLPPSTTTLLSSTISRHR